MRLKVKFPISFILIYLSLSYLMSSRYKTGKINEALQALPEILNLANDVLSEDKLDEINEISRFLIGSKQQRRYAKAKLKLEIGYKPTRPLWYLWPLIDSLPRLTRDSIRYCGDYLDILVKELTFEYLDGNARIRSLGTNARKLKKIAEINELVCYLIRYSDFIYTPGKHDFSLPDGRSHRFTSKEVVLTIYITAELGKRILSISENARDAVKADNWYAVGGPKWGSGTRNKFYGPRGNFDENNTSLNV